MAGTEANGKGWGELFGITAALLAGHAIWRRKKLGPDAMRRSKTAEDLFQNGSSLREPGRHIFVVTTAALPWLTGTAVNPLLRVAYLSRNTEIMVTLVIPWLEVEEQKLVYPNGQTFTVNAEQEAYMREWLSSRVDFEPRFDIIWYPSKYDNALKSIIPSGSGDITRVIPHDMADVAVLEEPEHLNWFNSGRRWIDTFCHVVGVCHTNYLEYARRESGEANARLLERINLWTVQMHCHKVIKLSDAVQPLPRSVTCFVHGVSERFLEVGDTTDGGEGQGAYFIGKAIWGKGYTELLTLLHDHSARRARPAIKLDVYGSGEDLEAIQAESNKLGLGCVFHGRRDHLDPELHRYRCFINPSTSDVVATTSAEALAMGKWIVVADHPENEFFKPFANCLVYRSPDEFSACVARALVEPPAPLTPRERYSLTWEAATERFLDAAEIKAGQWPPSVLTDQVGGLTYSLICEMLKTFKNGLTLSRRVALGFRKAVSKNSLAQLLAQQEAKQQQQKKKEAKQEARAMVEHAAA
mmetsp:Transcript_39599/g.112294  ORF Transcript_39599/g.112294 Transcript_39599/m.112294 type:complete len:526 (+) Transcript_39599:789-2366(+)|eukprot:CAMPEP_0117662564 /NCGR_PEP_ID=MMETSP0804-20121206/8118_1 /TAXON_ID=1074897 /ORGANISM="Tetraselmis astigmatica, Strain CCMP880" /LENGTH=525 /DNA_ID=CAMNT_0005469467 /DNA_START=776 /DNA_END=2353 /DNA_ORIENTATION=+